jgi:ABC-type transport system involved in resistance to organic solvents, permease component
MFIETFSVALASDNDMELRDFLVRTAKVYRFVISVIRDFLRRPLKAGRLCANVTGWARGRFFSSVSLHLLPVLSLRGNRVLRWRRLGPSHGFRRWYRRPLFEAWGPLITALICAGKLGSNIGAELGSMHVSEQIDAMEVSGTRPFSYLVTSRVTATTLMIPVLVIYTDFVALIGSSATVYFSTGRVSCCILMK